ncbi:MAG: NnrS family protein [Roseimicrobium sp.]
MTFPACKHRKCKGRSSAAAGLRWLAAEPFRLFFFIGTLWSIIGVSLWPLYYQGILGFYPSVCHSRLMIEVFGGAFVVGFLGTAGPRMASAPKLTSFELLWLLALHQGCATSHLLLRHAQGDILFIVLLASLLASLLVRVVRYREELPPPQLLLAFTGLCSGIAGAALFVRPATLMDLQQTRLAGLLLYQGLLLAPVLGIGSFIFPRIMGGSFGEANSPLEQRQKLQRTLVAAVLLVGSFFLEAFGAPLTGYITRAAVCVAYLLIEIRWRAPGDSASGGTLAAGLKWSLFTALSGLVLAGFFYPQRVSIEHLLYIGGFGLLIFIVASRVLFGHSGELNGFSARSWFRRIFIFLGLMAAATRMIPAFAPQVTVSHHQYAALIWAALAIAWLVWHGRRFVKREEE